MIDLFTWRDFTLPKVVFKKLGKQKSWGQYSENLIEIDERLKGKKLLEIHLHELCHWMFPTHSEDEVRKNSRMLTDYLWKHKYRKIEDEDK